MSLTGTAAETEITENLLLCLSRIVQVVETATVRPLPSLSQTSDMFVTVLTRIGPTQLILFIKLVVQIIPNCCQILPTFKHSTGFKILKFRCACNNIDLVAHSYVY